MVFDQAGGEVAKHQLEHTQILPRSGRVEHDPVEIWERTEAVIQHALRHGDLSGADLAAIGITNQRETTVVWDPPTAVPTATRSCGRTPAPTPSPRPWNARAAAT